MDFPQFLDFLIRTFIKPLTVLILALAVVYFLWNIAEGIRKGDSADERTEMKTRAAWGIVAIAVMVSLWGLVAILVNTFEPAGVDPGSFLFDADRMPSSFPGDGGSLPRPPSLEDGTGVREIVL